jgi:hypothetical protein
MIGNDRFEGAEATAALQAVYDGYRMYVNFLHPVRKLEQKKTSSGRIWKRYDSATTPYRRVLAATAIDLQPKHELAAQSRRLRPDISDRRSSKISDGCGHSVGNLSSRHGSRLR